MKINKPQHVWQLAFDFEWPTSIAFLGSHRRVAAGNRAGQILVWDLPESPPKSTDKKKDPPSVPPAFSFAGHTNAVTQLRATADGKTLISTSLDRTVRMWSPSTPPTGKVNVVLDQSVRVRNARRKKPAEQEKIMNAPGLSLNAVSATQTFKSHQDWVKALSLSNDGKRILTGDDACISIVHDLASQKEVSRWKGYSRVWVTAAALSPDGKTAFTAEFAGSRSSFDRPAAQARLWDVKTGKMKLDLLKLWTPKIKDKDRTDSYGYARSWGKLMKRGFVCAEFSPDGKILAAGQGGETDTGKIHLIDVASGKILRTVSGHRYGACDVTFSADGKYVLSSGRDTAVRICQVSDGKEIAVLGKSRGGQFKDWLHAIAISPDQQWVAAADIAGLVHLWKLAS
jgi:WD40 repeat protein